MRFGGRVKILAPSAILLSALLIAFLLLSIYDHRHLVWDLQERIQALEMRFEVEVRPLVIQKYGNTYINGEIVFPDPGQEEIILDGTD